MSESKELVVQEPVEVAPTPNPFAGLSLAFKHLGTFSDKSRMWLDLFKVEVSDMPPEPDPALPVRTARVRW